jgi:uncharacterized membrane protein
VVEDVFRFYYNNKSLPVKLKALRHTLSRSYGAEFLVSFRDSKCDIGRAEKYDKKIKKNTVKGVVLANMARAQESVRVLEELAKMAGRRSGLFKKIRFELYDIEKETILRRNGNKILFALKTTKKKITFFFSFIYLFIFLLIIFGCFSQRGIWQGAR